MNAAKTTKKNKIIILIVLTLVLALSFFLFLIQCRDTIDSDLPDHIRMAEEGQLYSLDTWIMNVLQRIWPSGGLVVLYLSVTVILTIAATVCFMKAISRYQYESSSQMIYIWLLSSAMLFICSIYIPKFFPWLYRNTIGTQPWHNSTYILMRPLAMLSLILFFKIDSHYREDIKASEWVLFTVLLTLTNFAKPNFIIAFAPMMLMFLIYDFIKSSGKSTKQAVMFGLCVLISLSVCLIQTKILFPDGENSGIAFTLKNAEEMLLNPAETVLRVVCGLAFPIFATAFLVKEKQTDRQTVQVWVMYLAARLESIFLMETGIRATDGNFLWGLSFAVYALFALLLCKWRDAYLAKKIQKTWFYIGFSIFVVHVLNGLIYFFEIMLRVRYYK